MYSPYSTHTFSYSSPTHIPKPHPPHITPPLPYLNPHSSMTDMGSIISSDATGAFDDPVSQVIAAGERVLAGSGGNSLSQVAR